MKRIMSLLAFSIVAFTLQGCASWGGVDVTVTGQNAYSSHKSLESAVLSVHVPDNETSSIATRIWGTVYPPNSRTSFAELLAHFATTTGGMTVLAPEKVAEQLRDADLDPTLRPTPAQQDTFINALECEGFFQADVKRWNYSYFLLRQRATIEFVLSFHTLDQKSSVWKAYVSYSGGGESDREVAAKALQTLFEKLTGDH